MAKKENPQEQPEEAIFRCHDGRTFRDMKELAEGLAAMSDDTFAYHVNSERNDFSKWVRDVIRDEKLADDLAKAKNRTQAAKYVNPRLAVVNGKGKMSKQQSKPADRDTKSIDMTGMKEHEHMGHDMGSEHAGHGKMSGHGDHGSHHAMMVADFRKRFWISLIISVPILILSPLIQKFLGIQGVISFPGDSYILFGLSSAVFFYGGWPFLKGLFDELKKKQPGMMTLIALAISVAYFYSSAVVFGVKGEVFFWELATLIDIMLLGHWIEMKSVMGASKALEELAKLMPDEAHKIDDNGNVTDVPVSELKHKVKLLIKPGEKIPADGKIYECNHCFID